MQQQTVLYRLAYTAFLLLACGVSVLSHRQLDGCSKTPIDLNWPVLSLSVDVAGSVQGE